MVKSSNVLQKMQQLHVFNKLPTRALLQNCLRCAQHKGGQIQFHRHMPIAAAELAANQLLHCRAAGDAGGSGGPNAKPPEKPPTVGAAPKKSGADTDKGQEKSKSCVKLNACNVCKTQNEVRKPGGDDGKRAATPRQAKDIPKAKVTLLPGDGIGPEISDAVRKIFSAAEVPIEWEEEELRTEKGKNGNLILPESLCTSLLQNRRALLGPVSWSKTASTRLLSKKFGLYAFVAECRNIPGYRTPYKPIDCVIIRDSTEGEYSGIEHEVVEGIIQTIKVCTSAAANRLADYVFQYAKERNRKKIKVAHKANIMRLTDGIFLQSLRNVASKHQEEFVFQERYLDTVCHEMIMNPLKQDIIVASSMYGDVLSTLAASIMGGLSLCPCFNVSKQGVIYDCAHRTADDIAGKDLANPTSLLLSSVIMLRDMNLDEYANKIESAVHEIYTEGKHLTIELGGNTKCSEFTDAICERVCQQEADDA